MSRHTRTMTTTWDELRSLEETKPYWGRLQNFLADERGHRGVLPAEDQVFAALDATPFDEVKIVVLGQDPYPTPGDAHGLAFSVPPGVDVPRSLRNIFTELTDDLHVPAPDHGCLEHWAQQGVLLLNTTLTVGPGDRNSHAGAEWWRFTTEVIRALGARPEPTVFMLWGAPARKKKKLIADHHCVIESSHPSPISVFRSSAAYESFCGSRPFSRANTFLKEHGRAPIDWRIPDVAT